jgi:hypothetical protein
MTCWERFWRESGRPEHQWLSRPTTSPRAMERHRTDICCPLHQQSAPWISTFFSSRVICHRRRLLQHLPFFFYQSGSIPSFLLVAHRFVPQQRLEEAGGSDCIVLLWSCYQEIVYAGYLTLSLIPRKPIQEAASRFVNMLTRFLQGLRANSSAFSHVQNSPLEWRAACFCRPEASILGDAAMPLLNMTSSGPRNLPFAAAHSYPQINSASLLGL